MPLRHKKNADSITSQEHFSKRRLAENVALARKANEKAQKAVEDTFDAHERANLRLHFYCECSNYNCQERIMLAPDLYKKIHRNRRQFIVKPGHELLKVEKVVEQQPDYFVVEKLSFRHVRGLLKNPLHKKVKPQPKASDAFALARKRQPVQTVKSRSR